MEDNGLKVLPGILSGTGTVIALSNYSKSSRFIPRGYSLGSALPVSEVEPAKIGTVFSMFVIPSGYWMREQQVIKELQFEDIPFDQVRKSLRKYADVLSTGDDDFGWANNIKHTSKINV